MELTTENLAKVVRDLRKCLGLTQSELAERAGCSQRLVSDVERGKTGVAFDKVLSIFTALDMQFGLFCAPVADPKGEIKRLQEEVFASLSKPKPKKPKLKEILEREGL